VIVADTHSWLWWLGDRRLLSTRALDALSGDTVAISPVTFWEVATLVRRHRITLNQPVIDWFRDGIARSSTAVVELTLEIGAAAGLLDSDLVRDPADRIIVATALHLGVPLVTKDRKIIESGIVPTIW